MESNGHEFFKLGKGKRRLESWIDYQQATKYLKRRNGQLSCDIESSEYVWLFTTSGIFSDGEQIWVLNDTETAEKGVRRLENPKKELQSHLVAGETFLTWQIKEDGKFIYGYYPGLQRILSNYNSVRHFPSVYALLEVIDFTGNYEDTRRAKKALQWGIDHLTLNHQHEKSHCCLW